LIPGFQRAALPHYTFYDIDCCMGLHMQIELGEIGEDGLDRKFGIVANRFARTFV